EILDPANVPLSLVDDLLELKTPYFIHVADAGLLSPHSLDVSATVVRSATEHSNPGPVPDERRWVNRWQELAEGAEQILVPCPQAEAFAASVLPRCNLEKIAQRVEQHNSARQTNRKAFHLGFVPARSCAHELWFISEIALRLARTSPEISFTVLGSTRDDLSLMRSGNIFVTGTVEAAEFDHLADALGVGQLLVSTTRPLFGHPILTAVRSSHLPTAYFDWSAGQIKANENDLPIDPGASMEEIVETLGRWMRSPVVGIDRLGAR